MQNVKGERLQQRFFLTFLTVSPYLNMPPLWSQNFELSLMIAYQHALLVSPASNQNLKSFLRISSYINKKPKSKTTTTKSKTKQQKSNTKTPSKTKINKQKIPTRKQNPKQQQENPPEW